MLNLHVSVYYKAFQYNFVTLMYIVYRRVHLSATLSKLGHFLLPKRTLFYDPVTKPLSIYFCQIFSKILSFQETKPSSPISCEENRGERITLNIFGVVM